MLSLADLFPTLNIYSMSSLVQFGPFSVQFVVVIGYVSSRPSSPRIEARPASTPCIHALYPRSAADPLELQGLKITYPQCSRNFPKTREKMKSKEGDCFQ